MECSSPPPPPPLLRFPHPPHNAFLTSNTSVEPLRPAHESAHCGRRGHQDEDGWWGHTETGELIGRVPELERPLSAPEIAKARAFLEGLPDLYESITRMGS